MKRKPILIKKLEQIPISQIDVSETNVRKTDPDDDLEKLQDSIKKDGLLQPIMVVKKNKRYSLIVGQRRYYAFKGLKKDKIPALVIEKLDPTSQLIVSFGENMHRKKLPFVDRVELCNTLFNEYHGNRSERVRKISNDLGISISTVSDYLAAELIPLEVQELVDKGTLSQKLAYRITAVNYPNVSKIIEIAKKVPRLTKDEKNRFTEYNSRSPSAGIDEILNYAKNPPPMAKLVIHITRKMNKDLEDRSDKENTNVEDIAKRAIERYLYN